MPVVNRIGLPDSYVLVSHMFLLAGVIKEMPPLKDSPSYEVIRQLFGHGGIFPPPI